MIKAILVASGNHLQDSIAQAVKAYCPNVSLLATADGIRQGVAAVNEHEPDVVLIDTKLADGSGFDLLRHFDKPDFRIIFLSASIDYAITAIKFNAVDYLQKPIDDEELTLALNKAADQIRAEENLRQKALGTGLRNLNQSQRLVLKTADQVFVVNIEDIIHIEADGSYATFYLEDNKKIIVTKPLKEFEDSLLNYGFHRIHRSHIFNINKISHLDKADGGFVVMKDGARIPVASRRREMLLELFEEIK